MEVNMPLAMAMLLYWNPTGPEKGDVSMVSPLLYSLAEKLAGSGKSRKLGPWASLAALVHCIIVCLGLV